MTTKRTFLKMLAASGAMPFVPGFAATARAADGDTIRFAAAQPGGDLDPHAYNGVWGYQDLMFEPLIGYGQGGTLVPLLAKSWSLDNDGKLLRLELREGVTFQDGAPWNADAMKWNLERWIHLEDHAWMSHVALFDGLDIHDPYHVDMKFREAPLNLFFELSYTRPVRYLSPTSVGADGKFAKPVGTGPWNQVSADNAQSTFKVFADYWGEKPQFGTLEIKVLPDGRSRVSALRAGEIDVTGGDFFAPITATEAKTMMNAGIEVEVSSGIAMLLGFNPERAPALADKRVRQAINAGFDRAAIAQVLYGGLAKPAGSMFPPSVPMSGTQFPPTTRDPDRARALLEEAGWTGDGIRQKDGVPLTLELVVSEEQIAGSRSMAEVMQAQLAEIGIGLTIRSVDHASRHSDIPARKYDMAFFLTFGAPYEPFGTINGYLLSTYDSGIDGKLVIDPTNVDPLVAASMSASEKDAPEKAQALFDYLHAEALFLPVLYTPSIWAHTKRVAGFKAPATKYDTPYDGLHVVQG